MKPRSEEAYAAQAEEGERPTLLMARVSTIQIHRSAQGAADAPPPSLVRSADGTLHLEEGKVFAQLDSDSLADDSLWHLDTGAMNHMMGSCLVFFELEGDIVGKVQFGDGSVRNVGWGCSSARMVSTRASEVCTSSHAWTPISLVLGN